MNQGSFAFDSPLHQMLSQFIPARARNTDPDTCHEAAKSWDKHKLTAVQAYVLSFFVENRDGTDLELEEWIAATYPDEKFGASSLRKRRGDLVEKGVLRDSGKTRVTGSKMKVWELAR